VRAYVPSYQLISPATLSEALQMLANDKGAWKPFAGGTDLMVLLEAGQLPHRNYVNIWHLKELRGIEVTSSFVRVGALTTYTEIQAHQILLEEFPMLCQAAQETGGMAIQNRGTIGGNIVNASPAADSPPALLAYDAELEMISQTGERRLPYYKFHAGYKQMEIRPGELVRAVYLPRDTKWLTHYYRKVGTRKAQAISKVCFAAVGRVADGAVETIRIALGSVAPMPIRCHQTESSILSRPIDDETIAAVKAALVAEISPISDIRSTKEYRLRVSLNLLDEFLRLVKAS
jgi:CO/xanthine dehydrogenase FAD-binding subunit